MFSMMSVQRSWGRFKSHMLAAPSGRPPAGAGALRRKDTALDSQSARPLKIALIKLRTRRIDSGSCLQLRPLLSAAWNHGVQTVILDLGEVVFMDSFGLSALVSEQRRRPPGTSIVVSALGAFVRDIFEVTQLDKVFEVYATSEAGVASLAA